MCYATLLCYTATALFLKESLYIPMDEHITTRHSLIQTSFSQRYCYVHLWMIGWHANWRDWAVLQMCPLARHWIPTSSRIPTKKKYIFFSPKLHLYDKQKSCFSSVTLDQFCSTLNSICYSLLKHYASPQIGTTISTAIKFLQLLKNSIYSWRIMIEYMINNKW